ncbi:MAG: hypothetical protein ACP5K1_03305 [Candidatus Bathyarchaeia archaeon]
MKLKGSLMFLEGYFIGVICYIALTCLIFDPSNVVGLIVSGLSAASGLFIYLRRRIGFYLALLSSASAFITFITAFHFSIKIKGGLTGTIYDASLALFSILSILAFIMVLDKYR